MAIVHIAIFDAVNAIEGRYHGYTGLDRADRVASVQAAIATAAHDTLNALFPSQSAACDAQLAEDLARLPQGRAQRNGIDLGRRAAARILEMRSDDGSFHPEPLLGVGWFPGDLPGDWRQDPISLNPFAMGAHWGEVRPFVLTSSDQFRVPPPPPLDSDEYAAAFSEVKELGGDGVTTPTTRTADQTVAGIYWAYDGTPSLCAPPRLYNQIALQIAEQRKTRLVPTARLLALINVAMADAGIAIWESKYHHNFWRPVTGVREAGTDGNPDTIGDPGFSPLGAPASNNPAAVNFTPPFPGLSFGTCRFRRRPVSGAAPLLRDGQHRLHLRVRRVQRRDARA
ncbi:MAG: vanadium-dependent haloperoxidase [Candidatus Polarisedimenticolia bacterium]